MTDDARPQPTFPALWWVLALTVAELWSLWTAQQVEASLAAAHLKDIEHPLSQTARSVANLRDMPVLIVWVSVALLSFAPWWLGRPPQRRSARTAFTGLLSLCWLFVACFNIAPYNINYGLSPGSRQQFDDQLTYPLRLPLLPHERRHWVLFLSLAALLVLAACLYRWIRYAVSEWQQPRSDNLVHEVVRAGFLGVPLGIVAMFGGADMGAQLSEVLPPPVFLLIPPAHVGALWGFGLALLAFALLRAQVVPTGLRSSDASSKLADRTEEGS